MKFLLLLLFFMLPTYQARALDCVPFPLDKEQIDRYDAIFVAQTFKSKKIEKKPGYLSLSRIIKYSPKILYLYKGDKDNIKSILRDEYWGDRFTEGSIYLVFANKDETKNYEANLCGHTTSLHNSKAYEYISILEEELDK